MKKLFGWILSLITASIIFAIAIILLPIKTMNIEKVEMTYIFVDENGIEYNIFEQKHGAASDWAFLFDDEINNNSGTNNSGENNTGYLPNKDYVGSGADLTNNTGKEIDMNELKENMENNQLEDEKLEKLLQEERIKELSGYEISSGEQIIFEDCITPWNNVIKHGESVLAYQQRKDVPTICNVQRRKCNDGELRGTYVQASCKEDIEYQYTKVAVVSFNNTEVGEFIQTPTGAKNDSAMFDNDGKINQAKNNVQTFWDNGNNDPVYTQESKDLTHKNYSNCIMNGGEIIAHGQFVRAYKSNLGFIDQQCEVELRLCLDGILKGNYSYDKCEYKDVTYQDYIAGNDDITKPTPDLMIETLTDKDVGGGLFGWIRGFFN